PRHRGDVFRRIDRRVRRLSSTLSTRVCTGQPPSGYVARFYEHDRTALQQSRHGPGGPLCTIASVAPGSELSAHHDGFGNLLSRDQGHRILSRVRREAHPCLEFSTARRGCRKPACEAGPVRDVFRSVLFHDRPARLPPDCGNHACRSDCSLKPTEMALWRRRNADRGHGAVLAFRGYRVGVPLSPALPDRCQIMSDHIVSVRTNVVVFVILLL